MEIIKLKDVITIESGKKPNNNLNSFLSTDKNFGLPFVKQSDVNGYLLESTKLFFDKKNYHLTKIENGDSLYFFPDAEAKPFYSKIKFCMSPTIWKLKVKEDKLRNKYLFYLLINGKEKINSLKHGTTIMHISKADFYKLTFNIPNISTQQSIIDIIEPKENLFHKYHQLIRIDNLDNFKNDWKVIIDIIEPFEIISEIVNNQLNYLQIIASKIINNKFNFINMKEKGILFEKGVNNKLLKFSPFGIPFINVSAINNKINNYIDKTLINLVNINLGDVVLSLDGNPGLVNNHLCGINGYGYKVFSKDNSVQNYQIYYSLLTKYNQDIIKKNAHGTTILHSSKSKDELVLMDFGKYNNFLEKFFKYEIILKSLNNLLKKTINNLINSYIK